MLLVTTVRARYVGFSEMVLVGVNTMETLQVKIIKTNQ